MKMANKAVFLDRDGTINIRPVGDYILRYEDFRFCSDFPEFLKYIKAKNFLAILISNQQCVGKNLLKPNGLEQIHSAMQADLLRLTGFCLDGMYWCGDLKNSGSIRRKPAPGMILEAVRDFNIDIDASIMIGDSESDIETGKRAGVLTLLIGNAEIDLIPDYKFLNFHDVIKSGIF